MSERSDADLAGLARVGDKAAFSALMRRYKAPLFRLIRRHVGDGDDAYDVLQQAFVAAWSAFGRFDPARPVGAWLRTIAINKCRDFGRRRAVTRILFGSAPEQETAAPEWPAREAAAQERRLVRLEAAITELPANLKEPLILTALEGLSHIEAGAALGLTVKAIETRVSRARKRLAAALPDMFADD